MMGTMMDQVEWALAIGVFAGSFLAASGAVFLFWRIAAQRPAFSAMAPTSAGPGAIMVMFDDERLIDATRAGRQLIDNSPAKGTDWTRFVAALLPRFPELNGAFSTLAQDGDQSLTARDGSARIIGQWRRGVARFQVINIEADPVQAFEQGGLTPEAHTALMHEVNTLRATVHHAPYLVWRNDEAGRLIWANQAYLDLATNGQTDDAGQWPPPSLFPLAGVGESRERLETRPSEQKRWFDVRRVRVDGDILGMAVPADKAVQAEKSLHEFVQTLTKTFADLPVGLAVFDRSRRLFLFNPALTDLTRLPANILSARPTLKEVLNLLRDNRVLPEPKNYKSWLDQIEGVEREAEQGTFQDTWMLPSGQTYRVSGQPHPDGALAFLIEDISDEVTLTRRFHSDVQIGRAVVDHLPDAIAVFAPDGGIVLTNRAYRDMWTGLDDEIAVDALDIAGSALIWQQRCAPSQVWAELQSYVRKIGDRAAWSGTARLWDGRQLDSHASALPGGWTMVSFVITTPQPAPRPVQPVTDQTTQTEA